MLDKNFIQQRAEMISFGAIHARYRCPGLLQLRSLMIAGSIDTEAMFCARSAI